MHVGITHYFVDYVICKLLDKKRYKRKQQISSEPDEHCILSVDIHMTFGEIRHRIELLCVTFESVSNGILDPPVALLNVGFVLL